ncbi:MAG: RNA-directed DNA polymerase [Patescibacteria group bacterium]
MFTPEDLLKAYFSCRKNKRNTINALKFEMVFESNLLQLHKELQNRTYSPGRSVCFVVTYPKLREVFAADFRDRVVHHLLVSHHEPHFEKRFIYSSFACRKKKGLLTATLYLKRVIRSATHNYTKKAFYGQFNIRSFFTSIDKNILKEIIICEIEDHFPEYRKDDLIWLTTIILDHDPTDNYYFKGDPKLLKQIPPHKTLFKAEKNRGLPIGNLTSQFFANVYLNELDQYVKRVLRIKRYVRYVDDFVVISDDLDEIKHWRKQIDVFLKQRLQLTLHPNKDKYNSVYSGIDFIGYIVKPKYILSRKRVVQNLKTKLHFFNQGILLVSQNQKQQALPLTTPPSRHDIEQMLAMVNSYYGHFKHANCYNLRRDIFENHFGKLKQFLKPVDDCCSYFTLVTT